MRYSIGLGLLLATAVLSLTSVTAQSNVPTVTGGLEWEARDSPTPALTLVVPFAGGAWFGYVNAPVYFSYRAADAEAVFYLPSPGGLSVCPARSCYAARVAYRWPDPDPLHTVTVLRFPNGLPFAPGQPGDPVTLQPGAGGTLRWLLP